MKKAFLSIMILLLVSSAYAAEISSVTIVDRLDSEGTLSETIGIDVASGKLDNLTLILPKGATNIYLDNKLAGLTNNTLSIPIDCTDCTKNIAYDLPGIVRKESSDLYSFSRTMDFPFNVSYLDYYVYLPPGYSIADIGSSPSVVPEASELLTNGKVIIARWEESSPKLPIRYYLSFSGFEHHETLFYEFTELSVWVIIIISISIGALAGHHTLGKLGKKKKAPSVVVPSSLFTPDEKTIINAIKGHNGISQKDIGRKLGWSKSKVSSLMTSLEYKKIIRREKVGRNYKVSLIKDIL